jgi:hypothetical protein
MLKILGVTITFGRTRPPPLVASRSMGIGVAAEIYPHFDFAQCNAPPYGHPSLRQAQGNAEEGISRRPQLKGAMFYESQLFQRRYSDRR